MNEAVYVVSAVRTPIGKFGGGLADFTAADLGTIAVRAALERAFGAAPPERTPGVFPEPPIRIASAASERGTGVRVDEVILGNARPAGVGPNIARQVAWRSGLGDEVPAFTVNMACASGLRAILLGWERIKLGEASVVVSAGAEAMSRVPYLLDGRWGFKMGHQPVTDAMHRDGFFCPMSQQVMGETAETLATLYHISREEQDAFALESQQRAARAQTECRFSAELIPVERTDKRGNVTRIAADEHVRADATLESLAKLPPVFSKGGTITAGNSSGLTDAGAALVLCSEGALRSMRVAPLARIVDAVVVSVDPRMMGVSPVLAVRKLESRTGWKLAEYDAVELNEAFAAQVLACDRDLHFDRAKINPNGGAIALGHPIGCTGARIVTTLAHHLRRTGGKRGLATLCVSGGLGVALAIEAE